MLAEFRGVEKDTNINSLSCLLRNIIAIWLFEPINMLITCMSIMQNATFIQISIRQFLSP